jgi:outer membrane protein assembly factor BamB
MRRLEALLAQGAHSSAAAQVELLMREHGEELMQVEGGRLVSVCQLVEGMTAPHRGRLGPAYAELFEGKIKTMFDALRRDENTTADAFGALAMRHWLWEGCLSAWVEAGDRAARVGDYAAAHCFFKRATEAGWEADDAHLAVVDACREMNGRMQASQAAPAFDAPWYGRADLAGGMKVFPFVDAGMIFLPGPRHVLALRENGQVAWRFSSPDAWARSSGGASQGQTYAAGVFMGGSGARVLVVGQPRGVSRDHGLRALRAADGKLLWSTEAQLEMDRVAFVSVPAVCGGYVYVAGVEAGEFESGLSLFAIDLMSGKVMFKCALGVLEGRKQEAKRAETWWTQSEVGVHEDMVYLTPGVGYAMAVGRFDGKIRWIRKYGAIEGNESLEKRLLRYRGTPVVSGEVVVIAPRDSAWMWGLDRSDGREIWRLKDAPAGAVIGVVAGQVIVAGSAVTAIDAATGNQRRLYDPASLKISGPPTIAGDVVHVPRSNGEILALSAQTGKPIPGSVKATALERTMSSEAAKKMLLEMELGGVFGMGSR